MVHKSIKLIQETAYRSGMRPIWNLVYIQINIWFLFFFFSAPEIVALEAVFYAKYLETIAFVVVFNNPNFDRGCALR